MKLILTSTALLMALLTLPPAAAGQTCTCSAPDTSCNVSVNCSKGCSAVCARKNACWATCGDPESPHLNVRVTLTGYGLNAKKVSEELTAQTHTEIVFTSRNAKDTYDYDYKNASLYDILTVLSKRGRVTVKGQDFNRILEVGAALVDGNGVSIKFGKLAIREVLDKLYLMTGQALTVESGDPDAIVSVSLPKATLRGVIADIEKQANVKLGSAKSVALK